MDIIMKKLKKLLEEMDAMDGGDDMEDITATLEDVILMLADADDDDRQEILDDARDELFDIACDLHDMDAMEKYEDELHGIIGIIESI